MKTLRIYTLILSIFLGFVAFIPSEGYCLSGFDSDSNYIKSIKSSSPYKSISKFSILDDISFKEYTDENGEPHVSMIAKMSNKDILNYLTMTLPKKKKDHPLFRDNVALKRLDMGEVYTSLNPNVHVEVLYTFNTRGDIINTTTTAYGLSGKFMFYSEESTFLFELYRQLHDISIHKLLTRLEPVATNIIKTITKSRLIYPMYGILYNFKSPAINKNGFSFPYTDMYYSKHSKDGKLGFQKTFSPIERDFNVAINFSLTDSDVKQFEIDFKKNKSFFDIPCINKVDFPILLMLQNTAIVATSDRLIIGSTFSSGNLNISTPEVHDEFIHWLKSQSTATQKPLVEYATEHSLKQDSDKTQVQQKIDKNDEIKLGGVQDAKLRSGYYYTKSNNAEYLSLFINSDGTGYMLGLECMNITWAINAGKLDIDMENGDGITGKIISDSSFILDNQQYDFDKNYQQQEYSYAENGYEGIATIGISSSDSQPHLIIETVDIAQGNTCSVYVSCENDKNSFVCHKVYGDAEGEIEILFKKNGDFVLTTDYALDQFCGARGNFTGNYVKKQSQ